MVLDSSYIDPNGRYLIISASINEVPLVLVNLYGPNNDDPNFFLEVFNKVDQFKYASIICAGDFNAVLGHLDYQGGRDTHSNVKSSEMLTTLMEEFNLCDIWRTFNPNLKQYTRHQKNPKVLSRIDYILVSDNFVTNCSQSKISPGIQSDHSLVTLNFKGAQPLRGPGFWKLNCQYLHKDSDFCTIIRDNIEEFKLINFKSNCNPNILWDALKCTITGICIEYCARKKKEKNFVKKELLREIEEVEKKLSVDLNDELLNEKDFLTKALNDILDEETKGLIIRSRIRWIEEGEKSSKYFCNLEKRSGEKKSIFKLKNDDDEIIVKQDTILEEIYSFYQLLYSKQCDNNLGDEKDVFFKFY